MGACVGKKKGDDYAVKVANDNNADNKKAGAAASSTIVQEDSGLRPMMVATKFHNEDINNVYATEDSKVLGSGFAGPVLLGEHKVSGKKYAIKSYKKKCRDSQKLQILKAEVNVYLKLDHPHIAKLLEVYEDDKMLYLVMEHCTGGELYHRLIQKKIFDENVARDVTSQMLKAVSYLHNTAKVVHRDLKLENWLYANKNPDSPVKLIDFGFAKFWQEGKQAKMVEDWGSLLYCAPDVINKNYTNKCDMWSLGVIVYMLLSGQAPFFSTEGEGAVLEKILSGQYSMHGKLWDKVSSRGRDFIKRLLVLDEKERMSASEALAHHWITSKPDKGRRDSALPLDISVISNLRDFAAASKLKRAVLCMIAYACTSEEISGIEKVFFKLDPEKTGEISLSEFFEVLKSHLIISNDEIDRLFAVMDSDHKGKLSYTEFVAAMLQTHVKMNEDVIRECFDRLDKDKKGVIHRDDVYAALGGEQFDGEDVSQLFQECGVKDTIDYDTFQKMMTAKFERGRNSVVAGATHVDAPEEVKKRKGSVTGLKIADKEMCQFEAILTKQGIDLSQFGKGEAKTVQDLFWEVQRSECVMGMHQMEFKRMIRVLRVMVWAKTPEGDRVLMEGGQVLGDGRTREGLNKRVAKKMTVGENWKDALSRALSSELLLSEDWQRKHLELQSQEEAENERLARGYPGVKTVYQFCDVRMTVKNPEDPECAIIGLPKGESFKTQETKVGHSFVWATEEDLHDTPEKSASMLLSKD